ncbi:MAG TPA: hypothetical protein PK453_16305 [Leptospiraceae bacterium]|nr:hypothetical protein [Leptospiraceae bacterium]HMY67069.1 hypothetical protein [Leptospiraceae bacterium]HNF15232.1 hypothetical protein [Leptospiraceae bacterium]HNF26213.1 hypothetical protein [Leptospiraceae bacterium]HNH07563.1 hypothetical protein [Leptospiraceae bacterium]
MEYQDEKGENRSALFASPTWDSVKIDEKKIPAQEILPTAYTEDLFDLSASGNNQITYIFFENLKKRLPESRVQD